METSTRIRKALSLALLSMLAVVSVPRGAEAEPAQSSEASAEPAAKTPAPSAAERARARRLFEEAAELESKREWAAAQDKLEEALGIVETPGLRYHLAYCQEAQGMMVEALGNYERAQRMIAAGAKAPDVAELLAPKRDALLARIPKLRIRARAPAVIERVAVDGVPLAAEASEQPIVLNPGRRRVSVWARGQTGPIEREVLVAEGQEHTEEFAWPSPSPAPAAGSFAAAPLGAPPPAAAAQEAGAPARPGVPARTAVLITEVTLTAVALGVGIGFLLSSNAANEEANELRSRLPPGDDTCIAPSDPAIVADCAALEDAIERYDLHRTIGSVGLITAAAGAVATVTTFALWKPSPGGAALGVSVTPTARGGALGLRGRF